MILDPVYKELHIKNIADTIIAKSLVENIAKSIGFNTETCEKIKLVALELAKNLVNHNTINGIIRITVNNLDILNKITLNICALDEGPGIKDIQKAILGQSSTKVGLGKGLASVFRLSDYVSIISNISSINNGGTIISTCFFNNKLQFTNDLDIFCIMKPNEASNISNDIVLLHKDHRILRVIIIDLPGMQDSNEHKNLYENTVTNIPLFWNIEKILEVLPQPNASLLAIKFDILNKKIEILLKDNIFFFQNGLTSLGHTSINSHKIFHYQVEKEFLLICHTDGQNKIDNAFLNFDCISNINNLQKTPSDIYLLGNLLFNPKRIYEDTTLLLLKWKNTN